MFNRVLRTAKWFAIHVLIVLVALYSLAIAHQPGVGFVLIAFAIGLLVFGTRRRSSVRKDVSLALEAGPTAPESHIRDPRDFER
jgi:hypothetical protein